MTPLSFNLVSEPWVPCIGRDGTPCLLGLRDTLVRAHDLAVVDADPPATAAVIRLLIAFVHRVLDGPKTTKDWSKAWAAGKFDDVAIDSYLGKWEERFDLFDSDHPFFQAPLDGASLRAPAVLDPAAAQGHNATLFDHSMDADPVPMPADEAARRLVALQAFSPGGTMSGEAGGPGYGKAAPLAGAWVYIVTGPSLFHTLLLNAPLLDSASERPFAALGDDSPVWERPPTQCAAVRDPAGWLDLLTYPSRRVRLVPGTVEGKGPLVIGVAVTDGDRPGDGWSPRGREQAIAFRETTTGWNTVRPAEDRDLWRDADVLLASSPTSEKPRIVEHVASMVVAGAIERDVRLGLDAYALATNRAKYLYWRHQRLPLRARLFHVDAAGESVSTATEGAKSVAQSLQRAVAELAGRPNKPTLDRDERKRRSTWAQHAMGDFWSRLAPGFDQFLSDLADEHDAFAGWSANLEGAARAAWGSWSGCRPDSPAEFQRVAAADLHYAGAIRIARQLREVPAA
jgi:CRISPR system Cascade subunit CasA